MQWMSVGRLYVSKNIPWFSKDLNLTIKFSPQRPQSWQLIERIPRVNKVLFQIEHYFYSSCGLIEFCLKSCLFQSKWLYFSFYLTSDKKWFSGCIMGACSLDNTLCLNQYSETTLSILVLTEVLCWPHLRQPVVQTRNISLSPLP
jgi:hypothetical protein